MVLNVRMRVSNECETYFFLFRVELLDYLDSIDCSLEDFQAMLSGRQFSIDPDLLVDVGILDTLYWWFMYVTCIIESHFPV